MTDMKTILTLVSALILVSLFSCNKVKTPGEDGAGIPTPLERDKDAFYVEEKCAVLLVWDSIQIDSLSKNVLEDILAEVASDVGYYQMLAEEGLEKEGVKVLSVDARKVVFVKTDGTERVIYRIPYNNGVMGKDLVFFDPDKDTLGVHAIMYEDNMDFLGVDNAPPFFEGYWVKGPLPDDLSDDYIFKFFYKTSYVNDMPLLQVFDNGEIIVEEVLEAREGGQYKLPKENIYYQFNEDEITVSEGGSIKGYIRVDAKKVKE